MQDVNERESEEKSTALKSLRHRNITFYFCRGTFIEILNAHVWTRVFAYEGIYNLFYSILHVKFSMLLYTFHHMNYILLYNMAVVYHISFFTILLNATYFDIYNIELAFLLYKIIFKGKLFRLVYDTVSTRHKYLWRDLLMRHIFFQYASRFGRVFSVYFQLDLPERLSGICNNLKYMWSFSVSWNNIERYYIV